APRDLDARRGPMGRPDPPRRRDLRRSVVVGGDRRLLRRPQPRAADDAHGAVLVAARRVRLPEALEPDRGFGGRRARARGNRVDAGARRRARGARAQRRDAPATRGGRAVVSARLAPAELLRDEILAMTAYPVPDASGLVKLDAMENPYPLPDPLRAELGRRLADVAINRYPRPDYR